MFSALLLFQLCILSFLKNKILYLLLFSCRKAFCRRQTSTDATNGTIPTFRTKFYSKLYTHHSGLRGEYGWGETVNDGVY